MRITSFLFFFCTTLIFAENSHSQNARVSIKQKNAPLVKVLDEIEDQTDYLFLYNSNQVDVNENVSVNVKNKPVNQLLSDLFSDSDIHYAMEGTHIVLSSSKNEPSSGVNSQQQAITITGSVTDSKGEALIGVSVAVKVTGQGTVTNVNGKYSISVPDENAVLVFSYLGYAAQEIKVGSQRTINLTLKESVSELNEVVVVGYGTQQKATLTGSVATVKNEDLIKAPVTNLISTLAGRMAGVVINTRGSNPGFEDIQVKIRGKSTWQNSDPLIIIDGIANRSGWERMNPDEVESVSVLKDASAAIYGSRAANGVILVTTKRGKEGRPVLEYHGDLGFTKFTRLPEMLNSWQFATYYTEANRSGYIYTPEEINKFKDGSDPNLYPNYNLYDYILRTAAPQTTQTLSIHGGNEIVKYFVSGRYLYQEAGYKNAADNFKNYGIRSNLDIKLLKNLNMSIDLAGRRDDRQRATFSAGKNGEVAGSGMFIETLGTNPTKPIFFENGLPAQIYDRNIVKEIEGAAGTNNERTTTINSQFKVRWDLPFITEGLYLEGTAAYDYSNVRTKEFNKRYDVYSYNKGTDTYVNLNINPVLNRSLYDYFYNSYRYTLNARLGYTKVFDAHSINTFIAYEQYSINTEWIEARRNSFLTDLIPYQFAGDPDNQTNNGSGSEFAYRNVFGRLAYAYNDRYMLDFTLRRDESLRFAPENRVGYFPGISAGWRISEESFIKDKYSFINQLKLRASWGQMGNDNVGDYQYLATAGLRTGDQNHVVGVDPKVVSTIYITGTPNRGIKWEVANTTDVGLEGTLWNGLLGFEIDYFYSKRSNILARRNASVPLYTGLTLPDENIGKAQNQGIEFMLSTRNRIGDFTYNVSANLTHTSNKIIFMDEALNLPDYQRREGFPIDSWLLYKSAGIFKTQEQFDNTAVKRAGARLGDIVYVNMDGDNTISDNDMVRLYESSLPKVIYGANFDFSYKGFDFSMLWQGQGGAKTYINPVRRGGDINPPTWLYEGRWTPETAESATMPRAFYHRSETANAINSDFWLRDASFLRLKTAELGYTIPKQISSKISISKARIYVSGFNLLLFDKIKVYDPEIVSTLGVSYPATKVFNVGIHITF